MSELAVGALTGPTETVRISSLGRRRALLIKARLVSPLGCFRRRLVVFKNCQTYGWRSRGVPDGPFVAIGFTGDCPSSGLVTALASGGGRKPCAEHLLGGPTSAATAIASAGPSKGRHLEGGDCLHSQGASTTGFLVT